MKHILEINDREALRYVISRELKNYGLKVPKEKKSASSNSVCKVHAQQHEELCSFGCPLSCLPSVSVDNESSHTVPRYLVECVEFLKLHLSSEGLFRKSGSRIRQKELKQNILDGESIPENSHCADVASLFKEFFRELPEPLFTHKLQETFLKCAQLDEDWKQKNAIMLLVTILPQSHFHTLLYLMSFLNDVAAHSENNKMNVRNLALVLTPNLIGLNEKQEKSSTLSEKILRIFMSVISLLIHQADRIGFLSETIADKIQNFANKSWSTVDGGLTSEDDLDCSGEAVLDEKIIKKKRRRSGSLQVHTPRNQGVNETPKIMRSKRKASEDSSAFTSAKRKALLKQLPADQRFSKHRARLQDMVHTTPTGYQGPPLGEVDGSQFNIVEWLVFLIDLTHDGQTVFKFSSPSLKFADESFCGFNATPVKSDKFLNLNTPKTTTPGKARLKKLNPLNSKKFKRRSFGALTHSLGGGTPSSEKGVSASISSIKKKLGHRSIKLQGTPVPPGLATGEQSIGWRLANRPPKSGLGTLKVVDDAITGQTKRSHKKSLSSPAKVLTGNKMYTKSSFGSGPAVTLQDLHFGKVATPQKDNTKSPKVMLVDVQMSWKGPVRNLNQETVANNNNNQVDQSAVAIPTAVVHVGRKLDSSLKRQGPVTPTTANKYRTNSVRTNQISHGSYIASPESSPEAAHPAAAMQHSTSRQSLSSVLSNISVTSTKSVFSVECNYNQVGHRPQSVMPPPRTYSQNAVSQSSVTTSTIGQAYSHAYTNSYNQAYNNSNQVYTQAYTNNQASIDQTNVQAHTNTGGYIEAYPQGYSHTEAYNHTPIYNNTQAYTNTQAIQYGSEVQEKDLGDGTASKTSSLDSLDTIGSEEELKAHQKLKKSTSVDSGRGASLYDSEGMYKIEDIAILIKNLEHTNEHIKTADTTSNSQVNYAPSYAANVNTQRKPRTLNKPKVQRPQSCQETKPALIEDNPKMEATDNQPALNSFYSSLPRGMSSKRTDGFCNRSQWQYSSCTLPTRRVTRSQTCPDGIGSLDARRLSHSVVEANVEFNATEENSPLKMLNRTPLRFSSRGRRPSLPSQPTEPVASFTKSERPLRKSFSAGSGVRSPKFPLTSLVKSISSESGLSRVDTQEPFDDEDEEDDSDDDEEDDIFKSRIPKNHFKQRPRFSQTQESMSRFQQLTPCQEAEDEDVIRRHHRPAPLVENCSDNILEEPPVIQQIPLTPLHLAKCTKVRSQGKKSVTHKYGTPTKSKRFGFLSKSKDDGNSTPKNSTKSPKKYPRSPVNPLNNPSIDMNSAYFTGEF